MDEKPSKTLPLGFCSFGWKLLIVHLYEKLVINWWSGEHRNSNFNLHLRLVLTWRYQKDKILCRIGTEHEKLGYYKSSHKRISYEHIAKLLEGLCSKHEWQPIMEGQYIIGAEKNGESVTIEPGGQFELSGAPVETLHDTMQEVRWHLDEVSSFILFSFLLRFSFFLNAQSVENIQCITEQSIMLSSAIGAHTRYAWKGEYLTNQISIIVWYKRCSHLVCQRLMVVSAMTVILSALANCFFSVFGIPTRQIKLCGVSYSAPDLTLNACVIVILWKL